MKSDDTTRRIEPAEDRDDNIHVCTLRCAPPVPKASGVDDGARRRGLVSPGKIDGDGARIRPIRCD